MIIKTPRVKLQIAVAICKERTFEETYDLSERVYIIGLKDKVDSDLISEIDDNHSIHLFEIKVIREGHVSCAIQNLTDI